MMGDLSRKKRDRQRRKMGKGKGEERKRMGDIGYSLGVHV